MAVRFEDYVATRSVALQRFAYLVARNAEDARDLVQDALLGLYPRWARVSAAGDVDAYVKRSIVNAGITRWRRTGREQVSDRLQEIAPDHAADVTDAELAWKLCGSLPTLQRAAVALRFYDDLEYAEIASILGCAEATARSHVHRALTRLRTQLIEDGSDD
ncbi:MAG: sigma-70 family RNA polymerase sigma factor [Micropruina sp.]|uniref:sigma-70 family RNA polymerase sigma factor n=1 Tax=Micropruina sp. TaxID=2737536 RepID=UPI0039E40CF5